jgi:hypothetical protein
MADMSDVLNVLTSIENYLVDLPAKILLKADQIYIVNGLSDVSENLGIITAGEFRAGNRLDPGRLFSGMRMAYPPMVYDLSGIPTNWNLVGIDADVLQFGVRASDGKLVAGGGAVILDEDGITAVGGTIAGWTINTDHLLSPNTPGIEINSTGSIKTTNFVSGVTGVGWRINETGDVEFNNAVIRGELRTTVFTYQEIQAVSGTMGVFKSAGVLKTTTGTIPAVSGSTTLSIKDPEYGHTQLFSAGDILRIKDGIRDTWLSVDSVSDETTYYDYVCTVKSGTTGGTYTAGQAVVNYGANGQGFLLMEAIGTGAPYFSVRTHAAAPYSATTEHVRMGNLNGNWGYSLAKYGVAIGQYATDKPNIILDEDGALTINIYDGATNNPVLQFDDTGSFITNVLNMTGANAAIAIGATPPTAKNAGTGLWLDQTGLYVVESNIQEIIVTSGVLKFGYREVEAYDSVPQQNYHWSYLNNDGIRFRLIYNPLALGLKVPTPTGNKIIWSDEYNNNPNTNFTIESDAQGDVSQYLFTNLSVFNYPIGLSNGYARLNLMSIARGGKSNRITVESGTLGDGIEISSHNIHIKDGFLNPWYHLSTNFSPQYVSSSSIKFSTSDGDLTSWFPVGTKIKFTQTTVKYFYVLSAVYSSSYTTLTLTGVGTYTVADAVISNFYYSHSAEAEMPVGSSTFIPLTTPLTSTSWNGDDTKTVGTITIDTSSVFGAPAGIKAALIFFRAKWTSASTSSFMYVRPIGATRYTDIIYADNTSYQTSNATVPCDENGDFEFVVGGANATEVICEIWGYWL